MGDKGFNFALYDRRKAGEGDKELYRMSFYKREVISADAETKGAAITLAAAMALGWKEE